MLFNSFHFLLFFIVVTAIYFALTHKYRWILLLASSCYFYMAFVPIYILILGFTIIVDYYAGIYIEKSYGRKRRNFLLASIFINIGTLVVFKYYNFLNDNISSFLYGVGLENPIPYLDILLPVGLSFHTFQAMSYTIEVYRGNQKAEKHFGIYSLYVMFYPQLVAGPIERPQNLLNQFHKEQFYEYQRVTDGLKLMAWGLFKKVVIADRIATVVDNVYDNPMNYNGIAFIIATIFFSFQIFCDFSGYSDIAIGSAQVMGFKLMKNFESPYQSKSIKEFWSRWHISLSTWFKDYLYISLGGNRVKIYRWYLNLFIVFLVSGLWHGANWTFIVWGALHGFYLIFGLITNSIRNKLLNLTGLDKLPRLINFFNVLITFSLVSFAWIFFRAKSVLLALYIVKESVRGLYSTFTELLFNKSFNYRLGLGISPLELIVAVLSIFLLELVNFKQRKGSVRVLINTLPVYQRWTLYYLIIFSIIYFGVFDQSSFIYFQF
jgi:D-alanyl-lipoteichoic acid acyltransferase DltB (MBOAT superfamily)